MTIISKLEGLISRREDVTLGSRYSSQEKTDQLLFGLGDVKGVGIPGEETILLVLHQWVRNEKQVC